jgi:drug/metabolite transporter (DMT)-like permease
VWGALLAALVGLAVVAQVWDGFTLDALGVVWGFGAALTLAIYYVTADIQVRRPRPRDPVSLTLWGMGAAAVFWALVQPWWSFPWASLGGVAHLAGEAGPVVPTAVLAGWMIVLGTVVPFSLVVLSMQHLRASQASVVGMTEPIFATAIAWVVLGESFTPIQMAGAVIVLGGVLVAERNR